MKLSKFIILITIMMSTSCVYDLPIDYKLTEWYGETKELGQVIVQFEDDQIIILTDVTEPIVSEYRMIAKDRISIYTKTKNKPTIEFIEIININNLSMVLTWHYVNQCTPVRMELLISGIYYNNKLKV